MTSNAVGCNKPFCRITQKLLFPTSAFAFLISTMFAFIRVDGCNHVAAFFVVHGPVDIVL